MTYRKIIVGLSLWIAGISGLHLTYNFNWADIINGRLPENLRKLYVAFIPVT
jgi:hypothetical protein